MADISRDDLVAVMDEHLYNKAYLDIEKAAVQLGSFILAACFIDAMAGFYAGLTKKDIYHGSSERFKCFVCKYLPQYEKDKLWEDLRCGLVHSYAAGPAYLFTNGKGQYHKQPKDGKTILNLEDFLADIRESYRQLRNDILTNNDIYEKAKRRYLDLGLMSEIKILI